MNPLEELRDDQARLRGRLQELNRGRVASSVARDVAGALAFAPLVIRGLGYFSSVVLSFSYATPGIVLGMASGRTSDEIDAVTQSLLEIEAEIVYESEYATLKDIFDDTQQRGGDTREVAERLRDTHLDRVVRDHFRDAPDPFESTSFRDLYDHVEPPVFEGVLAGGSSDFGPDVSVA